MQVPALLYHHVGWPVGGTFSGLTVPPDVFERQLGWLRRLGYTGITPSQWLAWARQGRSLPPRPVILVFDDGYADLTEFAFPALLRHGFGAAVYVVTDRLGDVNEWDVAGDSAPLRLMTAEQVRQWSDRGIEIGSHSRTHSDLATLTPGALRSEVDGSAGYLRELVGKEIVSFAYPFGSHNREIREIVAKRFSMAWTIEEGRNSLGSDLHRLRRTPVQAKDSFFDFLLRLRFGTNRLERLRRRIVRRRSGC